MRTTMTLPTSTIQTSTTTSNSKSTISEFLYYKNNVWAPQKLKPPYNSKLTELLYYKNNYWSKTNFLKHSSTTSKNMSIPLKKVPNSAAYPLKEDITLDKKQGDIVKDGFNTLNFFEGIICVITLYLIGFISYKLYNSTYSIYDVHSFDRREKDYVRAPENVYPLEYGRQGGVSATC